MNRISAKGRQNLRLLSTFNFCNDFRMYAPIAVVYFAKLSGSAALAALIFSIAKITSSLFELPTGLFSDMVGRKKTLVLGQIASLFSILCFAGATGFTLLAAGAALEGFAFSCFSGNNEALLYDTLTDEGEQARYVDFQGRLSAMFQAALAISAAIAAMTLSWLSLRDMFWLSLIPQGCGVVVAILLTEPRAHDRSIKANIGTHLRDAVAGFKNNARLRELSLASMLTFAIGEAKHLVYPAFFALLWPPWALGVAGMATHAFAALGFRSGGWLVSRLRELPVLLWCKVISVGLGLSATAFPTVASPAISSLSSLAFGPAMVAQGGLMQKGFSDRQRATMASLISLGGNVMFAAAVVALGILVDQIGARFALLTAEILSIPVALLYLRLYRAR